MSLFDKFKIATETPEYVIIDEVDYWPIDKTYKDMGIEEGWLEFTGYYRDYRGVLMFTYKHIVK